MNITIKKVLELEEKTKCPILECFKTNGEWYVCFEEYITIEGEEQIVHLDELMDELKKFDNIYDFTNEVYIDDTRYDSWFEQVTFTWRE